MAQPEMPAYKILIVDDRIENVHLVEAILQSAGYTNLVATTEARDVLGMCALQSPDLLVLDLHMPFLNGIEVIRQLRNSQPRKRQASILMLTSDASEEIHQTALETGANDLMTKPFKRDELVRRVGELLTARSRFPEATRQQWPQ